VSRARAALGVILLAGLLAGCAEPEDPSRLHSRCEGADKVFILDDPDQGSDLVVLPNHPDC
jgi:hypothetical protein